MKAIMKSKWIWIGGGIILAIGLFALVQGVGGSVATAAETGDTAVAFTGDLTEGLSASGQVAAEREASLSLSMSGTVDAVNVDVGDFVNDDDVLLRLDTAVLERAVASAEEDVAIATADLADLLAEPAAEDLAAAEAAVFTARAQLDDLLDGPGEEEIAASEAGVRAAEANVRSAAAELTAAYDVSEADIVAAEANLKAAIEQQESAHNTWVLLADCEENETGGHTCAPTDSDRMETATQNVAAANAQVTLAQTRLDELRSPDASSISSAQASLSAAEAQYDAIIARHNALLLGASDADIAASKADIANAQASLDSLLEGPQETDITIFETRLAQAETGLQQARNELADAELRAPFDGVITAVHANEGEQTSSLAIEMVENSQLEAILSVDEVDIGRLSVGQPAVLTIESWPNVEIEASITAIAPSATSNSSGIVSYQVHLGLGEADIPVLVGMTVNADLITARREDVLLIPNAAITADRDAGTFTVNRVQTEPDGSTTISLVQVTVGLKDSDHTQITGGLSEGDIVLLGQLSVPTEQRFAPGQGGFAR